MIKMHCAHNGCQHEITFKDRNLPPSRYGPRLAGIAATARDGREPMMSQAYGARFPGGRIESRFCERHTCLYFFRAETCPAKKHESDTVCIRHAQCDVEGCPKGKIQYLNTAGNDQEGSPIWHRLDFCADHKCAVSSCTYLRAMGPGERPVFEEHCEFHGCHVPGCKKLRHEDLVCCPDHKCRYGNCLLMVAEKQWLCAGHLKCEDKECPYPKQIYPGSKNYKPYCMQHSNCDDENCQTKRQEDSNHCKRHTCPERDCENSRGDFRYCNDHRCRFPGCQHPSAFLDHRNRMVLCAMHICRVHLCGNGVDEQTLFCKQHGCGMPNCKSEGVVDHGNGEPRMRICAEHMKLEVEKEQKKKAKAAEDALKKKLQESEAALQELRFDQRIRSYESKQASHGRETFVPVASIAPFAPAAPAGPLHQPYPRGQGGVPHPPPDENWPGPSKNDPKPPSGAIKF